MHRMYTHIVGDGGAILYLLRPLRLCPVSLLKCPRRVCVSVCLSVCLSVYFGLFAFLLYPRGGYAHFRNLYKDLI
jgi:hypothetical protein